MSPYRDEFKEVDDRLPFKKWLRVVWDDLDDGLKLLMAIGGVIALVSVAFAAIILLPKQVVFGGLLVVMFSPLWISLGFLTRTAWRHRKSLRLGRR